MSSGLKVKAAKARNSSDDTSDVLGLSMLSLSGFQIYHICDKKLFPYFLISEKKSKKSSQSKRS